MKHVLKQIADNKVEVLEIKPNHSNGRYSLYVHKEVETTEDGYTMCEFIPFADGNFSAVLGHGRKSQKKLDTINSVVKELEEDIVKLWEMGLYKTLLDTIQAELQKKKLFA